MLRPGERTLNDSRRVVSLFAAQQIDFTKQMSRTMPDDQQFLIAKGDRLHNRIAPTDISGFLRSGQCRRFLRLRLYERSEGRKAFEQFGTPLQSAPQMLT